MKPEELAKREVINVDISTRRANDVKPKYDPSEFLSESTGRGPIKPGWDKTTDPVMCCYKLVTLKFQVFGLQTKVEDLILKVDFCIILLLLI